MYFRCDIVQLHEIEEIELKRRFNKNFPKIALYLRKSALEIGLILPNTIIVMLKLKMYVGNIRKRGNTADAMIAQEDMQNVEAMRNIILRENPNQRY